MLLVICFVSFLLMILFAILEDRTRVDFESICCITIFIFSVSLIATVFITIDVANGRTIDERIQLYSEQNKKIETEITELVEKYMAYESKTFKELSPDSAITLVSLYPDLKSDTLVQSQCDLYIDNNKKILSLKESKIVLSVKKWWLYFGR